MSRNPLLLIYDPVEVQCASTDELAGVSPPNSSGGHTPRVSNRNTLNIQLSAI
ncbi:MAG: hypothetical protein ACFB0B_05000 [Thermonemataceae bacterium]